MSACGWAVRVYFGLGALLACAAMGLGHRATALFLATSPRRSLCVACGHGTIGAWSTRAAANGPERLAMDQGLVALGTRAGDVVLPDDVGHGNVVAVGYAFRPVLPAHQLYARYSTMQQLPALQLRPATGVSRAVAPDVRPQETYLGASDPAQAPKEDSTKRSLCRTTPRHTDCTGLL